MKYIHNQQDTDPKLSRIIKVNQKHTLPFHAKNTPQTNLNNNPNPHPNLNSHSNPKHSLDKPEIPIHPPKNAEREARPSLSTCKSTPEDRVFMEKHKLRNRCMLSRNMVRNKKAGSFFGEKENRGGGTAKMERCKKLKTEGSLERSKTRNEIRARYEREPFVLSPWIFTEENIES